MADLSAIRANIAVMKQQLLNSPVFVTGRPDSAAKAEKEATRLEQFSESLRITIRDLNSSESLIRLRESELKTIPRDRRWSAEQSLKQLGENVRAVKQEAEALAELVRDLLDRNGLLNPIQKTKAIVDLLKEFERGSGSDAQAILQHVSSRATIGPPPAGAISLAGIAPALAFVYIALKILARRLRTQANSQSPS
jgi:hypothetical protein